MTRIISHRIMAKNMVSQDEMMSIDTKSPNSERNSRDSISPAAQVLADLRAKADRWENDRDAILQACLMNAPFDGWTAAMLDTACADAGVDRADIALCFPGGIIEVLDYWSLRTDMSMLEAMTSDEFAEKKIRDKVTHAVWARLETLDGQEEAARRASATLALPMYAPRATQFIWRTADHIWRGLGDKSLDFNYYSKRSILSGVWVSTFARWISDDSDGKTKTRDFLDDRIANVMSIEKLKADWRQRDIDPAQFIADTLVPFLGKIRYPR